MNAPAAFRALKGFFCVYKPVEKPMTELVMDIQHNLTQGLNRMPGRPIRQRVVYSEENLGTDLPVATAVPDLADHPLVVGDRYLKEDITVQHTDSISRHSSGLVVMCVNTEESELMKKSYSLARQMKVYHVSGKLGTGTLNCMPSGKLVERSTYDHVTQNKLDKLLAGIQTGHQKYMFELCGVNIQSQEAYELASQGLIRPAVTEHTNPLIYSIKCIHFKPPHFTLEIHSINEFCVYLRKLIHEIGLELKTNAVCTQLRRLRYGHFTLEHALLRKHWSVVEILKNIDLCRSLLTEEKLRLEGNVKETEQDDWLRLSDGQALIGESRDSNQNVIGQGSDSNRHLIGQSIGPRQNGVGQSRDSIHVQEKGS